MTLYYCASENRRQAVRDAVDGQGDPFVNGMDFVEVVPGSGQRELEAHFIHPLPQQANGVPGGPALDVTNFRIVRQPPHAGRNAISIDLIDIQDNIATLTVAEPGDFAFYELLLVAAAGADAPPAGFDTQLAILQFSFKAACPTDADCKEVSLCDDDSAPPPFIDYRARDFESFNRVLTDRLRQLLPRWRGDSPADQVAAMVDLFAYIGDHLNYELDWAGTETYLDTALERVSVQRHARLRDYSLHEGNNARAWIAIEVSGQATVPRGTRIVAGSPDQHRLALSGRWEGMDSRRSAIFETIHEQALDPGVNRISIYTWGAEECVLCEGATSATLVDPGVPLEGFLLFEQVLDPQREDGRMLTSYRDGQRCVVRITSVQQEVDVVTNTQLVRVNWSEEDALPFSLCLSSRVDDVVITDVTVARGNILLADHGLSIEQTMTDPSVPNQHATEVEQRWESRRRGLSPYQAPEDDTYRPAILAAHNPVTRAESWDITSPASRALSQSSGQAIPRMHLVSRNGEWRPTADILAHDSNDRVFVPEVDNHDITHLRFGRGEHGRAPENLEGFIAHVRVGNGRAGNVGVESLTTIVLPGAPIQRVRNPLPAAGGTEPEQVERVKRFAPVAFRKQQRAVTLQDYIDRAREFPGVQDAHATFRWLASWYTVVLSVDRIGGLPIDEEFHTSFIEHMNRYRLMGYDVMLRDPLRVPLDIELHVCLADGANRALVETELARPFGAQRGGLFHPDNIGFGYTLFSSQIIDAAMSINGVLDAVLTKFQRFGESSQGELDDGRLVARPNELLELRNDPSAPGRGRIRWSFDRRLEDVAP